jgi:hypothetical protein
MDSISPPLVKKIITNQIQLYVDEAYREYQEKNGKYEASQSYIQGRNEIKVLLLFLFSFVFLRMSN